MTDRTETTGETRSALYLPRPVLGACIFAGVLRDTRGVSLSADQRFNYYPANPTAKLHWIFQGKLRMVTTDTAGDTAKITEELPRLLISGPQRNPLASWSSGEVYAMSVAFFPDALSQLLQFPVATLVDKTLPLECVAPAEFVRLCERLFESPACEDPFPALESLLTPLWHGPAKAPMPRIANWIHSLGTRLVFSRAACGLRQLQRRVKDHTGQSLRELELYSRGEAILSGLAGHQDMRQINLGALAANSGFADQSHMNREVRRLTGQTPARLCQCIEEHEAFWFYRLLLRQQKSRTQNPVTLGKFRAG